MLRTILTYGAISGSAAIAGVIASMVVSGGHGSVWLGYLIMIIALSSIFVAVKRRRDRDFGGTIRFGLALGLGLAIAVVASLVYAAGWEAYQAATGYAFMDDYIAGALEAKRAAGVAAEAYAKLAAEMETMREQYKNPAFRAVMTLAEIFPVGLVISLGTAALLRNPKILPARKAG